MPNEQVIAEKPTVNPGYNLQRPYTSTTPGDCPIVTYHLQTEPGHILIKLPNV